MIHPFPGSFEARLAAAVLDVLDAEIAVLDAKGVIVAVNRAWQRFAEENDATDPAAYLGADYLAVCERAAREGDEAAAAALDGIRGVLCGERDRVSLEYPCHTRGTERWFVLRATRLSPEAPARVVIFHEDVSERRWAEMAQKSAQQVLSLVLETLPVGVWIMDETGRIVHGNPAGQKIWAGARYVGPEQFGEYKGWRRSTGERIAADDWAAARAIRKGEVSIDEEIDIECFDGTHKIILNSAMPFYEPPGRLRGAVIVNQDITDRTRAADQQAAALRAVDTANRELAQALERETVAARTDSLTGICNRRHFFDLATQAFAVATRYSQPLAVILFDVDHFKEVNDRFGHAMGDHVLRVVAEVAGRRAREADLLARYGGEEFILLLPQTSAASAAVMAESIREDLAAQGVVAGGMRAAVTISAGVAERLGEGDTLDGLIRRADGAMYAAKRQGRDRTVTFSDSMQLTP